ncbi:MAG: hypothetical protein ACJAX5_000984 [Patiriisocius sp.]|jgi:hypothetical protein
MEAKPFDKYSIGELPAFTALLGIEKCVIFSERLYSQIPTDNPAPKSTKPL